MTSQTIHQIREDVLARSRNWIHDFNLGKSDACIAAYTPDAVMRAKPMGTFIGTEAIAQFWKPFMASGAKELTYADVNIEIVDESTALLSATWSMNVGRGVITKEKWIKQENGDWLLAEDNFEVLEQFQ